MVWLQILSLNNDCFGICDCNLSLPYFFLKIILKFVAEQLHLTSFYVDFNNGNYVFHLLVVVTLSHR